MHAGLGQKRYYCLPKLNVSWRLFSLRCSTTPLDIVAAKKKLRLLWKVKHFYPIVLGYDDAGNYSSDVIINISARCLRYLIFFLFNSWYVYWGDGYYNSQTQTTLGPFQVIHQYPKYQNYYQVTVYYCSNPPFPQSRCCDVLQGSITTFQEDP